MVRTRVRAPGVSRTRSARTVSITLTSRAARRATRARQAGSKARSPREGAAARGRPAAWGEARADYAHVAAGEKGDGFTQSRLEGDFAAHGPLGDRRDAPLQPKHCGKLVDAFLQDHGGIHVGD